MADGDKININGQEYDPEEVSSLIELGNKYRQTEKDLNTPIDRLMPEYTKATQRAARAEQLERDLADRDRLLEEYKSKETRAAIPDEEKAQREYARKLGLADVDYLKEQGYMTKSEMDEYFSQKQTQQQLVDNVLKQADGLEREIDGADGRVPFNKKAVLAYASAYNISDLKDAYDDMNDRANEKWKEAEIEKAKRPGLTTLGPGGKKIPVEKKIETAEDLTNAWTEMFGQ